MPLSRQQIAYIQHRIVQDGINSNALQNDIVDHICCSIEREMKDSSDFENIFNKVYNDFKPAGGLQAIELEVTYLSKHKAILMKKLTLILVFLAAMLFFFTTLLNGIRLLYNYDWYFMGELALINQCAISLFIIPLYWLHQYKNARNQSSDGLSEKSRQFMFVFGFLCSEALANAIFFKLMHMPGGNQLFIITAVLGMIYVPFYVFRKYKLEY